MHTGASKKEENWRDTDEIRLYNHVKELCDFVKKSIIEDRKKATKRSGCRKCGRKK
jgi:hypothetical protein